MPLDYSTTAILHTPRLQPTASAQAQRSNLGMLNFFCPPNFCNVAWPSHPPRRCVSPRIRQKNTQGTDRSHGPFPRSWVAQDENCTRGPLFYLVSLARDALMISSNNINKREKEVRNYDVKEERDFCSWVKWDRARQNIVMYNIHGV